jgi:hypothetical protein
MNVVRGDRFLRGMVLGSELKPDREQSTIAIPESEAGRHLSARSDRGKGRCTRRARLRRSWFPSIQHRIDPTPGPTQGQSTPIAQYKAPDRMSRICSACEEKGESRSY